MYKEGRSARTAICSLGYLQPEKAHSGGSRDINLENPRLPGMLAGRCQFGLRATIMLESRNQDEKVCEIGIQHA